MSPIEEPSAIHFHDATSSNAEVPSLFTTTHAPRVSTQKIPRHTTLKGFGPPQLQQKTSRWPGNREERSPPPTKGMSLWTESIFSKRKELGHFDDSSLSLLNESLGVEKRLRGGKGCGQKTTRGRLHNTFLQEKRERREQDNFASRLEDRNRATRRRSLAKAEKSYDHEVGLNRVCVCII